VFLAVCRIQNNGINNVLKKHFDRFRLLRAQNFVEALSIPSKAKALLLAASVIAVI